MDVRIYSVKANSHAGDMSLYYYNTKNSKPQDTLLGISKIYASCQEVQQGSSCPGESAAGVTYLSFRIHPKS